MMYAGMFFLAALSAAYADSSCPGGSISSRNGFEVVTVGAEFESRENASVVITSDREFFVYAECTGSEEPLFSEKSGTSGFQLSFRCESSMLRGHFLDIYSGKNLRRFEVEPLSPAIQQNVVVQVNDGLRSFQTDWCHVRPIRAGGKLSLFYSQYSGF